MIRIAIWIWKSLLRAWCWLAGHSWKRTVGLGFRCRACKRPLVEIVAMKGQK